MRNTTVIIIFIFLSLTIYAQHSIGLSSGAIMGFNTQPINLWKYSVDESPSIGVYINIDYKYKFKKPIFIRSGLGFMQYYAKVKINKTTVTGYNNNFNLPLSFGYIYNDKWSGEIGASLQDYRERDEFATLKSYNLRTNIIFRVSYIFLPRWTVNLNYSTMVSKKLNSFIITHRANHIMLGVSYMAFESKHKSKS